ncbi:nucleotidyltransferase domain-containing protein [Patescibacteria group bacterium]|nr:nucleotidyltransferase domain-containing protein [Patescibacteria group bacterium]
MSKEKAKKIVKQYIEVLKKENFPLTAVYLYGSHAKGNPHFGSDIDVAIISPRLRKNWNKTEAWLWKARRNVNSLIEPVGYAPENFIDADPLVTEIKTTGIRIV